MTDKSFLSQITCKATDCVKDAIACIEISNGQICLVIDDDYRLIGTVTDGDIRRGLIQGKTLESPVHGVMKRDPKACHKDTSAEEIKRIVKQTDVKQMPIVDENGVLIDLIFDQDLRNMVSLQPNEVVLMAGGLGTRLRPLTENIPKPMIEVGGKPILETIIENFTNQGFYKFTICINYLGDMIETYFGDGGEFGAQIQYVKEDKRLGTAGALSMLPKRPDAPFFVMNADILTNISFMQMRAFHKDHDLTATMAVNDYTMSVPYGVIETDGDKITDIREKPKYTFFVNAGIYVLSPEALNHLPNETFFDMPDLFVTLSQKSFRTNAFPVHEHWIDVGKHEDLSLANESIQNMLAAK